ncbi:MAG: hypothetical protein ACJAYU_002700 [Bradymonadia bacterium]
MATRRRGAASLDDLKARLGYNEPTAPSADEPTQQSEVEGEATAVRMPGDGSAVPPAASAGGAPAPAYVPPSDDAGIFDEDYSQAVAEEETFNYDPHQTDKDIKPPASKTFMATLLACAATLILGLVVGVVGTANNTSRALENATTADAGTVLDAVRPVASRLGLLNADLSAMPAESTYVAGFEDRLRGEYTGQDLPVVDPALIASAKTLMVFNDVLGRQLIEYAVATSYLASTVERHLRSTSADTDEIGSLQAASADATNYGIAIEFETLLGRFQSFIENAEENPFTPIAAERVTYENLVMVIEGEGDEQREFYTVTTATGDTINVLIHDLVLMPTEQLLPPVSSENALDRYLARAGQIKELLTQVTAMQTELQSQLEDISDNQIYFTF